MTQKPKEKDTVLIPVCKNIRNMIQYMRENPYCELTVIVKGGIPISIKETTKQILL